MISGISPRLNRDEGYRTFLELVARQVGTDIASARAYEEERRRADMLAELDRAKTTFFNNVSHEFQRWLKPKIRRRFHFHFTPTRSSWLNQVERLFGLLTQRMIPRGTFHCVDELESAIYQWLANWNKEPHPFVWTATADIILDKIRRSREAYCKVLGRTGD